MSEAGTRAASFTMPTGNEVMIPLRVRSDGREPSFFSTIPTFGLRSASVAGPAGESCRPAGQVTAALLRERVGW